MGSEDELRRLAKLIDEHRAGIVDRALEAAFQASPGSGERFGEAGRASCRKDLGYHLDYLEQALRFADPGLFSSYLQWLGRLFAGLGFRPDSVEGALSALGAGLRALLPPEQAGLALAFMGSAVREPAAPAAAGIGQAAPPEAVAAPYIAALLAGDRQGAGAIATGLVAGGMSIKELYLRVFQASQYEIGRLWLAGEISVAQEHFCTAATQAIMSGFYPAIFSTPRLGKRLVAASVGGELHELGIRMVADLFELAGWDSYYLGANSPPAAIVAALRERKARLLCLSATMAWNLSGIEAVIGLAREGFPAGELRVLVGGGPFNQSPELWRQVGADGYAPDATGALELADRLLPGNAAR